MDYYIGQKIVCVHPKRNSSCPYPLVEGQIYTVSHLYLCRCSSLQVCLREASYDINMICKCGRVELRQQSYYAWRFRGLEYWEIYGDLYDKKKEQGEKTDIPYVIPKILKTN